MKINFWKILKKYQSFKKLLLEFWKLYYLVREYLDVLGKVPEFEEILKNIWELKTDVFGEEK